MYELKKNWKVILPVNLLVPGPRLIKKKRIYRAAVSQRLRNTVLDDIVTFNHTYLSCLLFKDVFFVAYLRPIHRGMQNYYEG